ncbi:hypothetical protein JCM19992_29300 [Thermostilla marina]
MKRHLVVGLTLLAACLATTVAIRPVWAISQFKKEFETKYVKPDSKDPKDVAFAQAVAEAKCNICHEGTSKKNRNLYGQALDKLLDRRLDARNPEKIREALDAVAKMPSRPRKPDEPKDVKIPTFGELIAQGKLPVPLPKKEEEK